METGGRPETPTDIKWIGTIGCSWHMLLSLKSLDKSDCSFDRKRFTLKAILRFKCLLLCLLWQILSKLAGHCSKSGKGRCSSDSLVMKNFCRFKRLQSRVWYSMAICQTCYISIKLRLNDMSISLNVPRTHWQEVLMRHSVTASIRLVNNHSTWVSRTHWVWCWCKIYAW